MQLLYIYNGFWNPGPFLSTKSKGPYSLNTGSEFFLIFEGVKYYAHSSFCSSAAFLPPLFFKWETMKLGPRGLSLPLSLLFLSGSGFLPPSIRSKASEADVLPHLTAQTHSCPFFTAALTDAVQKSEVKRGEKHLPLTICQTENQTRLSLTLLTGSQQRRSRSRSMALTNCFWNEKNGKW